MHNYHIFSAVLIFLLVVFTDTVLFLFDCLIHITFLNLPLNLLLNLLLDFSRLYLEREN